MRKIGSRPFNFGPNFYAWMNRFDHLPLVRSYCGRAGYRNLYLMLGVYNPDGTTERFVKELLADIQALGAGAGEQLVKERETTFVTSANQVDNTTGFLMDNYLDAAGTRTHHILEGSGTFTRLHDGLVVEYAAGDVLAFTAEDFGKRWKHAGAGHQLVTCWSAEDSGKRNWELFAEYERRNNIKEARA